MRVTSVLAALLALAPDSLAAKDIVLEEFGDVNDGEGSTPPSHDWFALTDPVMGGQSSGSATAADGVGVFVGEVKNVVSLGAPGFIAMQTRFGWWPDLSSCDGLEISSMSANDYGGFRVSFGTAHVTANSPYARGHKAPFQPGINSFTKVVIPFTDFSDNWDSKTGDITVPCSFDEQYCPDADTLKDLQRFEIMAEGVLGEVDLKIMSIKAVGCDDDVVETNPNPGGSNNPQSRNSGGGSPSSFGQKDVEFVGNVKPEILKNGDIRIESWPDPRHAWYAINDPVMGGQSTGTVAVTDEVAVFDGEVVDVPFLSAPGFVKMESRGGPFPDVRGCKALKLKIKSPNKYEGLRVTFGVHHSDATMPFIRGYKAHLDLEASNSFQEVVMPFTDFSDNWDPYTGDVKVRCKENSVHCPDEATLTYFTTFSIMGEGVDGKVHVEVKSIDATDCAAASKEENNGVDTTLVVGLSVGFVAVALVSFFIGRRTARRSSVSKPVADDGDSVDQGFDTGVSLPQIE